jgi:hypothetical protein
VGTGRFGRTPGNQSPAREATQIHVPQGDEDRSTRSSRRSLTPIPEVESHGFHGQPRTSNALFPGYQIEANCCHVATIVPFAFLRLGRLSLTLETRSPSINQAWPAICASWRNLEPHPRMARMTTEQIDLDLRLSG